jgi:hypothetical protein
LEGTLTNARFDFFILNKTRNLIELSSITYQYRMNIVPAASAFKSLQMKFTPEEDQIAAIFISAHLQG